MVESAQISLLKKQERKDKTGMIKEMAAGDMQDSELIRIKNFMMVQ
jgi:hypothetical protein